MELALYLHRRNVLLWIMLWTAGSHTLFAQALHYSLSIDEKTYQFVHVTIRVDEPVGRRLVFSLPNWIPGAYEWREFGEQVVSFKAVNGLGQAVPVEKLSRNDWEIQPTTGSPLLVTYALQPVGRYFLGTSLDSSGGLLEGAATWMYIRAMELQPLDLTITMPEKWRFSTALSKRPHGYFAANYDELVDSPVLIGSLRDTVFTVANRPHHIFFRGDADISVPLFTAMLNKIVQAQCDFWGGLPYERYQFQYIWSSDEKGASGLEHRNSTTIRLSALEVMQDVKKAASISSHEFFHLWNVKRITSAAFVPLQYDQEARTESLWWFEGVTSYYGDLFLLRSGVWSLSEYLHALEQGIERLQENPDRLQTSLAHSSWRVWQNGLGGPGISYYNKGELVGLLLDLFIRKVTRNQKSLDDVIRYMYHRYTEDGRGMKDREFAVVLQQLTGKDFAPFFDRYVNGLVELPYKEILAFAGLDVELESRPFPSIGRIRILGPRNRVFSLDETCAASLAGLRRNDLILQLDDQPIAGEENLYKIVQSKKVGDVCSLLIRRDSFEKTLLVTVDKVDRIKCSITPAENLNQDQRQIRDNWMTGK
jgi:predicted metalloprotease with PDZ domain